MGITIEIDNLAGIDYTEYYITGFWQLKEKGLIDRVKITCGTDPWGIKVKPGYFPYIYRKIYRYKGGQLLPFLIKPLTVTNPELGDIHQFFLFGRITEGKRSKTFVIDTSDVPWDFRYIDTTNFYFKSQFPKTFSKGYVDLSRHERFSIPENAIANSKKIHPLILGRPLGRILDFSLNKRLLNRYAQMRAHTKRKIRLLAFLGTMIDGFSLSTSTHPPSIKRAELVTKAHQQIPGSKCILSISKEIEEMNISAETLALKNRIPVTDRKYQRLIYDSYATLNITGAAGSIPWRILDGFLSGMIPISDNFLVDWYEPLTPGKDFLSIGNLGYELLQDVNIEDSFLQLKDYVENIETYYLSTAEERAEKFNNYFSPESVARYMLSEMGYL
jgi:hypothetical protein